MAERTLGLIEAAALLRLHPSTLRERAKAKRIPGAKAGREWVFVEADLVAFLRLQYEEQPCLSISRKGPVSGGSVSVIPTSVGYAGRLEQLIAQKRSACTTSGRRSSGGSRASKAVHGGKP